jgi:elongation factor P
LKNDLEGGYAKALGFDQRRFHIAEGRRWVETTAARALLAGLRPWAPVATSRFGAKYEGITVKVIASSIRKGNILEREDGQLYVVLSAESFHPGKGTPTTQIDMRRLSDGVKTTDRYKTTEQVERAFVEDSNFNYLYQDGDGYTFMNAESYEQVIVPNDVLGDQAVYLQEGMMCIVSMFNGIPVGIQLPARVVLEIVETEPAMKGQTASSSYKPAKLSNGARIMVPPHIATGTRVVVQTEDGSYVERAKD